MLQGNDIILHGRSSIEVDTFETTCSFNNRFGESIHLGVLDDGDVFEAFVPVRWVESDAAKDVLPTHDPYDSIVGDEQHGVAPSEAFFMWMDDARTGRDNLALDDAKE